MAFHKLSQQSLPQKIYRRHLLDVDSQPLRTDACNQRPIIDPTENPTASIFNHISMTIKPLKKESDMTSGVLSIFLKKTSVRRRKQQTEGNRRGAAPPHVGSAVASCSQHQSSHVAVSIFGQSAHGVTWQERQEDVKNLMWFLQAWGK